MKEHVSYAHQANTPPIADPHHVYRAHVANKPMPTQPGVYSARRVSSRWRAPNANNAQSTNIHLPDHVNASVVVQDQK